MLTIAGGVILGFIGILILGALLSSEEGVSCLFSALGIVLLLGVLFVLYAMLGDTLWAILGTLIGLGVAVAAMGGLYGAIEAWKLKRATPLSGEQRPVDDHPTKPNA